VEKVEFCGALGDETWDTARCRKRIQIHSIKDVSDMSASMMMNLLDFLKISLKIISVRITYG
jgi:hypothetical protein